MFFNPQIQFKLLSFFSLVYMLLLLLMRDLSIEVRNMCKTISLLIRLSHFPIPIFIFTGSFVGSLLTFRMRSSPNGSNNNSFWSNRMKKCIHMFSMATKQCENRKTHWIRMLTMNNNQLGTNWKKQPNKTKTNRTFLCIRLFNADVCRAMCTKCMNKYGDQPQQQQHQKWWLGY